MSEKKKKAEGEKKVSEGKKPEEKKRKIGVFVAIILGIVLAVLGVVFGVKAVAGRTIVEETEAIQAEKSEEFLKYFRGFVGSRLRAANLFGYSFREKSNEEILGELGELKDGFSMVSRGVAEELKGTEFVEIGEIMEHDATLYLKTVRELRAVMTKEFSNEADRQAEFLKLAQASDEAFRSEIYVAEAAFEEGTGGLGGKAVTIFQGEMVMEVGGGVMNVFVGDFERGVTAVTGDDFSSGEVKTIRGEKEFLVGGGEIYKIGEGVKNELVEGKLNVVEIKKEGEAKVVRRKIGLAGKTTWSLVEELKAEGTEGLVLEGERESQSRVLEREANAVLGGR